MWVVMLDIIMSAKSFTNLHNYAVLVHKLAAHACLQHTMSVYREVVISLAPQSRDYNMQRHNFFTVVVQFKQFSCCRSSFALSREANYFF